MKLNRNGMTLIETMMAAAVMGLIVAASMSLVSPILKLKKQMDTDTGFNLILTRLRECIINDVAWENTLSDPKNAAQMTCLISPTKPGASYLPIPPNPASPQCTDGATSAPIEILDKSGNPCLGTYGFLSPSSGFSSDGIPCAPYGGPACSFHISATWTASCPGGAGSQCQNPLIHVSAQTTFNAGSSNHTPPNTARLSFDLVRGRADRIQRFVLAETTPAGAPSTSQCNSNYRKFDATVQADSGAYVPLGGNPFGDGTFVLNPGTYSCEISAPAYMVGSHKIVLADTAGNTLLVGTSEYAPPVSNYPQSRSYASGVFTVNAGQARLGVRHFCANPTLASPVGWAMGAPAIGLPNVPETYAIMSCSVVSR